MLKKKRFWIPIVSVLVIAMGCGLFYGRKVANQEPVKIITPVEVEKPATPKPPPPGETYETEHWHGDEWHTEPHEAEETALRSGEIQRDGVWYPDDYTQADLAADLAGESATTDEEYHRRAMKNRVNIYLREHRKKYPDCTEQEAVLADAIRQAEWHLADEKHVEKRRIHKAELDVIMSLYDDFREKYDDTLYAGKKLSPASAQVAESERQAILERLDAHDEQAKILKHEKPIYPKPIHTH